MKWPLLALKLAPLHWSQSNPQISLVRRTSQFPCLSIIRECVCACVHEVVKPAATTDEKSFIARQNRGIEREIAVLRAYLAFLHRQKMSWLSRYRCCAFLSHRGRLVVTKIAENHFMTFSSDERNFGRPSHEFIFANASTPRGRLCANYARVVPTALNAA